MSDIVACRAHEPEVIDKLRCKIPTTSRSDDNCLTDQRLSTLFALRDGLSLLYRLAAAANRYPGYNVFQGTRLTGKLGLAHEPESAQLPTFPANGYLFAQGYGYVRYFVVQDATFDSLTLTCCTPPNISGNWSRYLGRSAP